MHARIERINWKSMGVSDLIPLFRRHKRGFTLVELLVVVAIIALLVSILVPSVQKAQELARRSVCGTNLHSISIALAGYTTDHGRFPDLEDRNSEGWRWAGNLLFDWPGLADDRPTRPLNPYLSITAVSYDSDRGFSPDVASPTRCPSDTVEKFDVANGRPPHTFYQGLGTSYWFNAHGKPGPDLDGLKGRKVANIRQPGKVIAAADFGLESLMSLNPFYNGPHEQSNWAGNGLFVDGHAAWCTFEPVDILTEYWHGDDWTVLVE